ncbi:hypothetical protein QN277_025455 [Acacia crassicarpa]|uniref:Smr domain-containing protein n=1 Tax=Acacia crassicarpa TaxID=499986 RepID=A0AAE1MJL8_9FABA|nr:hypothetical protein QN277_025455 [Acacia crassicarpa]
MIRAKQISTLSSGARSFFIGGSRYSTPDGSTSTCSEDETFAPRRKQTKNEALLAQKPPTLATKTASGVARTLVSGDSVNGVGSHSVQGVYQSGCTPKTVSTPSPSQKSDSVAYACVADDVQIHAAHTSTFNAEPVFRAGIAAVNFLSDVANYKLPLLDGSHGTGILNYSKNCVIDTTRSLPDIKSSNGKHIKKEAFSSVHPKPSVSSDVGSNCTSNYQGARGHSDKSNLSKGIKHFPSTGTRKSAAASKPAVYGHDQGDVPQRTRTLPNQLVKNSVSNTQTSDPQFAGSISKGFNKQHENLRTPTVIAQTNRHFANKGRVVEAVSDILQKLKWSPATEKALYNLNCSLDAYQANQILKPLHDYSVALGFFNWLKRQPGFKHDDHTYTTMVGILGRARQFGSINKLLEQMVSDGCKPNVVTYNRMIHNYGRANCLKEALNVFHQMQEEKCEPDRVTYCTLIDIHAKAGYLEVAMTMYERMQQAGLSPDTFTYSVMINCLGKSGNLTAAHRLFCEMVGQGCIPNLVTYNIMIALQAKARNYQIALQLFSDMKNAGYEPDKVTYSIVMEALGHCGYLEQAEVIFAEMKWKNLVPDEPVYGLLVDLWGKAGNVEKAWAWYQEMVNAGLQPNVPTCNSLLSAFLRVHRLPDAYNLLQSMVAHGLRPSSQTYTLLLGCCTEARSSYDMGFCCELLSVTGHPAHAFLLSMPAAGPDGQNVRDHASKFLDLMHAEDRESKRGLVDAVVNFLYKSGLKEEAGSIWEVAAEKNVYPDAVKEKSSCYWLINLHVMSDGTAVTALSRILASFRRQMLTYGTSPSRIDIITGWGRRSRVTGSSLVRQAVQELLHLFGFPFFIEKGNSGCFVGCGDPLSKWLVHSSVERMHLL